jgi:hypothetical protein
VTAPRLVPADSVAEIIPAYRDTPIEGLLRYHNLREVYPAVLIAPLLYRVEDDRLLQIVA